MAVYISEVGREFTAGEAEKLTGVSTALQRDWRRRGLLDELQDGPKKRFSLSEVCILAMMQGFSEGGVSVKSALTLAKMTCFGTLSGLMSLPGAVAFEGVALSEANRSDFITGKWGGMSRFVFAPLPHTPGVEGKVNAYTLASLTDLEGLTGKGWFYGLTFDLHALAQRIHAKAKAEGLLPLVTCHVADAPE
jgi:DNA-binding transcriptional MerR regulator